jgi:hypothetical protein
MRAFFSIAAKSIYSNRTKLGVNDGTRAAKIVEQRASACNIDSLTKARSPNRRKWLL